MGRSASRLKEFREATTGRTIGERHLLQRAKGPQRGSGDDQ